MARRVYTCADCGAEFQNLAALTAHKSECPAAALRHMTDDDPAQSDKEASADAPTTPAAANPAKPVEKPAPKLETPKAAAEPKAAQDSFPPIPWDTPGVDPTLKVLIGNTPIRFEGQAYAREDGLHIFEVRTTRRR